MRVLLGGAADLRAAYAVTESSWLRLNFVATVDGAVQGQSGDSGSINNAADKQVYDLLRELSDCVVVGAGTARIEGYGTWVRPTVVVTRSGGLPATLLGPDAESTLVVTCAAAPGLEQLRSETGDDRLIVLGDDDVDLTGLRPALAERGLRQILCEGGPHLARDLLAAGAVDEMCTSTVGRAIAGDHLRMLAGPPLDVPLSLGAMVLDEPSSTLFTRWLVDRKSQE